MSRRTTGETTEDKEDDKGSMEWNRNKVGSRISDVITKRLTIIRTKARGKHTRTEGNSSWRQRGT